jgi:hypothetical protein
MGVRVRGALERGGANSRAARTLERGGACSRLAHPLERGGAFPREARALERGGVCFEGIFEWAALVGRQGHRGVGHALRA